MIKTYRKTATIQAEQFDGSKGMCKRYDILDKKINRPDMPNDFRWILKTLEGNMVVKKYEWLATGVNGEHWAIADDIFKKTYVELPVIPKFIAEYIKQMKLKGKSLGYALKYWLTNDDIDEYMEDNSEKFAQTWLDGYQVEADK